MAFEPIIIKHAPWSISKVGVLELCARQYLHKYVEKLKESTKSDAGRIGTSLHSVLEYGLKNPEKALDVIVEVVIANDKLTSEEELVVRTKLAAIEEFIERMEKFKLQTRPKQIVVEHKVALSPDFKPVDFFAKEGTNVLRGVIDYAQLTHDNVLLVIDHKSGRRKPIDEHAVQLNAYRIMGLAAFPEARAVQCAINYVGATKLDWAPRRDGSPGPYTREEVEQFLHPWLEMYLNKQGRKLLTLDSGSAEAETGWQCEYCGFASQCDEGKIEVNRRRAKRGEKPLDL
jgi:hypothetical protein